MSFIFSYRHQQSPAGKEIQKQFFRYLQVVAQAHNAKEGIVCTIEIFYDAMFNHVETIAEQIQKELRRANLIVYLLSHAYFAVCSLKNTYTKNICITKKNTKETVCLLIMTTMLQNLTAYNVMKTLLVIAMG